MHFIFQLSTNKQITQADAGAAVVLGLSAGLPRQAASISRRGSGLAGGAEQRKPFSVCELPDYTMSLSHVASSQLQDNLSGLAASQGFKTFLSCGRRKWWQKRDVGMNKVTRSSLNRH